MRSLSAQCNTRAKVVAKHVAGLLPATQYAVSERRREFNRTAPALRTPCKLPQAISFLLPPMMNFERARASTLSRVDDPTLSMPEFRKDAYRVCAQFYAFSQHFEQLIDMFQCFDLLDEPE